MVSRSLMFSLLSGATAALSSVMGKLTMTSEHSKSVCRTAAMSWLSFESVEAHYTCESFLYLVRLLLLILTILCNTVMWWLYTRALRYSSSTVEVSVVNIAMNIFCSAIFGQTFFGEQLSLQWFAGAVLIVIGLTVMHLADETADAEEPVVVKKKCDLKYPGASVIYERHKARKVD